MKFFQILILCSLLSGCLATGAESGTSNWRTEAYDKEAEIIGGKVKSGAMKRSTANKEMVIVAKTYFPNDPLLIGTWEDIADLSSRVDAGELPEAEFQELVAMRWKRFDLANRGRHAEAQAIEDQQRRRDATGAFVQSLGNSMKRSNPQAVQCNSYRLGAQVSTTCY